jgi:hypothetical protein
MTSKESPGGNKDPQDKEPEPIKPSLAKRLGKAVLDAAVVTVYGAAGLLIVATIIDIAEPGNKKTSTAAASAPAAHIIRAPKPPRSLPKTVRRMYDSAIELNYGNYKGSAVKVGPRLAFSAGHMVIPARGEGHPKPIECGINSSTENIYTSPGGYDQITNWTGKFDGLETNPIAPDYSLLKIRPDPQFDRLPIAPIVKSTPAKGSLAYFINYEENSPNGGLERFPNQALANYYEGQNFGHAAEYAGIVLGMYDGFLAIAQNLQSYGPSQHKEVVSHDGASGGPIFNKYGQLEGVVSNGVTATTAGEITQQYGMHLQLNPKQGVDIEYVQPIDQSLFKQARASLGPSSFC